MVHSTIREHWFRQWFATKEVMLSQRMMAQFNDAYMRHTVWWVNTYCLFFQRTTHLMLKDNYLKPPNLIKNINRGPHNSEQTRKAWSHFTVPKTSGRKLLISGAKCRFCLNKIFFHFSYPNSCIPFWLTLEPIPKSETTLDLTISTSLLHCALPPVPHKG